MKTYIYFVVPLAKWVTNILFMMLIFGFLFPNPIAPWVDLIIGWSVSAILAAPFAYWAFKKQIPTDKQLGIFILSWVVVTALIEAVVDFIVQPLPWMYLLRYEFLVQTLLEIMVVLLMARIMRRQYAYHMAAPGIDLDATHDQQS